MKETIEKARRIGKFTACTLVVALTLFNFTQIFYFGVKQGEKHATKFENEQSKVENLNASHFISEAALLSNSTSYALPEFAYPKTCHFEILQKEESKSIDIALFYHVGIMNHWKSIVYDQLQSLEYCGLGHMASSLTVTYSIQPEYYNNSDYATTFTDFINQFTFTKTLNLTFIKALEVPWESEAMGSIAHTCRLSHDDGLREESLDGTRGKKTIVFYFHNKGVSHYTEDWKEHCYSRDFTYCKALHWRKYMEWFLIEKPTLCLYALLYHGASTCGVNLFSWPSWHYSGNFWAASCDWIRSIPPVVDKSDEGFMKYIAAELWIGTGIKDLNFTQHVGFDFHGRKGHDTNVPYKKVLIPEHYSNISEHLIGLYPNLWRQYVDSQKVNT
jgi:hypothetical protein